MKRDQTFCNCKLTQFLTYEKVHPFSLFYTYNICIVYIMLPLAYIYVRCNLRPRKRPLEINPEENLKEYYLDKNTKWKSNNLETIYEEGDNTTDDCIHVGAKRFKRMLLFNPEPTASKLKRRHARMQKIFGSKHSQKKRAVTMQMLLDRLNSIRTNSVKTNSELK